MVTEVNKLIYNSLVKHGAIHLPMVGTLLITRSSAKQQGNRVAAPINRVEFSSHAEAISLVNVITEECGVAIEDAEDIYARWHNRAANGAILSIDGVGKLQDKSFVLDEEFSRAINANSFGSIKIKPRRKCVPAYISAAILLIIAAIYVFILSDFNIYNTQQTTNTITDIEGIATSEIIDDTVPENLPIIEEIVASESDDVEPVIEDIEPIIEEQVVVAEPEVGYMVVVGSFETKANAENYAASIERRAEEINCRIQPLGRLYAVIAFVAEDKVDCQEFMSDYIKLFPHAWIHTPRELR